MRLSSVLLSFMVRIFSSITIPAAGVTGIRNIFVRGTSTTAGDVDTVAAGNFGGVVQFVSDRSTNAVTFTGLSAGQAVGINGNAAATIGTVTAGYGATVTAETVNLTGGTGNSASPSVGPALVITGAALVTATVNSSGATNTLASLQLAGANTVTTLNVAATSALTVTGAVSGLGSAVAASTVETVNITGNSAVTFTGGLTGGGGNIATLNINVNNGSTLGVAGGFSNGMFSAGATINVAGTSTTTTASAASVTLGTLNANVKTLSASGLTNGGVSATIGANTATVFTGGGGTDIITIGAGTGAALTGTLAGGAGNDIIAFSTGADLAASLTTLVSGFETLRVSSGAVGVTQTYNPLLITGINSYQVAAGTGSTTLTNLLANASVTVIGSNTIAGIANAAATEVAGTLTLALADASGALDVINLTLNNQATTGTNVSGVVIGGTGATGDANEGIGIGGLALGGSPTVGQIETLNLVSAGRVAGTGTYNTVTLKGSAAPFTDPNIVKISGAAGIQILTGASTHGQTIDASASTGGVIVDALTTALGAGGTLSLIGSGVNDTFSVGTANVASIYGGAGGDAVNLATGVQTLVYKAGTESQLDLTGTYVGVAAVAGTNVTTNTGNSGASGTGGTVNSGKMDVITGFTTGTDKIDLSSFSLTGALGGGLGGNGTAGGQTATDDAGFNALLANANLFSDGVLARGIAQIHGTAGMSSGVLGDFIVVDVNKDGLYTAGTDLVIKLAGTATVALADFNL